MGLVCLQAQYFGTQVDVYTNFGGGLLFHMLPRQRTGYPLLLLGGSNGLSCFLLLNSYESKLWLGCDGRGHFGEHQFREEEQEEQKGEEKKKRKKGLSTGREKWRVDRPGRHMLLGDSCKALIRIPQIQRGTCNRTQYLRAQTS